LAKSEAPSAAKERRRRILMNELKVNKTNILPLRWFANMCGEIAGWSILKAAYLDEDEHYGWKYKVHSKIYKYTWPVYYKFGTFYEFSFDMNGDGWNDYDENGVPYWEKLGTQDLDGNPIWDYIDNKTGDAFRIIRERKI
jgi:hypothetical protein